jgi:hypothetical protein
MGGLLAARVLADYYEQVTIIERDRFSANPEPRKGVPQTHIPHLKGRLNNNFEPPN